MKFSKYLIAASLAATAFGASAQNLVKNGSFEETVIAGAPGQSAGTWTVYNSIIGWTGAPNIEVRDSVAGTTPFGNNFVELDTHGTLAANTNSSMYQDILGTGLVDLTFWYSARPNTNNKTNDLQVTFGSFAATVLEGVGNATSSHNWIKYTASNIQLEADGSTRLTFFARGADDTYGGSLDNVSVTAVPEVETYAMMLAGLGLMGTIARRRKAKAA